MRFDALIRMANVRTPESGIECENCRTFFKPKKPWQKFCKPKCRTEHFWRMNHVTSRSSEPLDESMDSVFASMLGKIAAESGEYGSQKAGDNIDTGLFMCRLLREKGFEIRRTQV